MVDPSDPISRTLSAGEIGVLSWPSPSDGVVVRHLPVAEAPNTGWTQDELRRLSALAKRKFPAAHVARVLHRSLNSTKKRRPDWACTWVPMTAGLKGKHAS